MAQARRAAAPLLITAAYIHDLTPGRAAGFIRIANTGRAPVTLTGWRLVLDGKGLLFPGGAGIGPGREIHVARDALAFQRLTGAWPEWQYAGRSSRAPRLEAPDGLPDPSPWTGSAVLLDPDGRPVDALAWGSLAVEVPGWAGAPLPSAPPGEVYLRARDERSWRLLDTGRRRDWKQGHLWLPLRSYRVGQSDFPPQTFTVEGPITASVAPDCTLAALVPVLDGARRSIDLNLYQITSAALYNRLVAAVHRGVRLRVFLDGTPAQPLLDKTRYLARMLAEHGADVRWMISDPRQGVMKRYRYNHAKYAVVDGRQVLVWSENWSRHSFPERVGGGNRGWGLFVESPALARYLAGVFAADWDPGRPDSIPLLPGHPQWGGLPENPDSGSGDPQYGYRPQFRPLTVRGRCRVTPVLAPDHALMETGGIIGLLRRAVSSLEVECQYIPLHWGMPDHGSPEETPNLFLAEVVAAARRGARVRVLVGAREPEPWFPQDSVHTIDYLNTLARRERLDLAARAENSATGVSIHNKGVIVDRRWTLVTSINWSENAPGHNREVGLIVESPEIAAYFGQAFDWDWNHARP